MAAHGNGDLAATTTTTTTTIAKENEAWTAASAAPWPPSTGLRGTPYAPRATKAPRPSSPSSTTAITPPGMREAWEQMKEMRDREEAANQRAGFLEQGFGAAWVEGAHTDIVVKPGNGPPIPAHKAILMDPYLVFDPAVSPHYEVFSTPYVPVDPAQDSMEWPPSSWLLDVFSSSTRQWHDKSFLRQGEAIGTVANALLDPMMPCSGGPR
ncbi:hypothetical protein TRIUR3_27486 [Triticum urartu]|uniref:BTB domain-containing protein n=1 Tax=Triticum urartu TaxID=4572 RepID=M7ZP30_TRIUA|nr:hypothetical protein TRIUR3_27486 [Triticum urartu]